MQEEGFFEMLGARIAQLDTGLDMLHDAFGDKIVELRGKGFLRGIKLAEPYQAGTLNGILRDHHLLAVPAADNVLRLLPPLTIAPQEVEKLLMILHDGFKAL